MPTSHRLLRGVVATRMTTEIKILEITRKRDNCFEAPRPEDSVAWRISADGRELVMRSPLNPDAWLTVAEFENLKDELIARDIVFDRRRGFRPVIAPKEGEFGWKTCPGYRHRRYRLRYMQEGWVSAPSRLTDDY